MTRLCETHRGINLAQGFPDFEAPAALKQAAIAAIQQDHNQYAITWGSKRLRDALAAKLERFNKIPADPERNLVVTCGSTEAMMAAMLAVVNPSEEVVLLEPFYENYGPDALLAEARPRFVPLDPPSFALEPERLKEAFTRRTKAIIINTPNNPSGKVFTGEELKLIADLCTDHDCLAITDEIYEQIVFDGLRHTSLASLRDMAERTITVGGFSKTYSVTGWRIGYAAAPATIATALKRVHDFLTVGAPAPLQEAAVAALELPESYYEELRAMYARKRGILLGILEGLGFRCVRPQAAYYILADFTAFGFQNDVTFARHLVEHIGVAAVPGSSFYRHKGRGERLVRFTFSKRDETLREAGRRLQRLLAPSS